MASTTAATVIYAGGVGSIWTLCNITYAMMRAQNKQGLGRKAAFICGFPHTAVTYFAVDEGSESAYGVDVPRKSNGIKKMDNATTD